MTSQKVIDILKSTVARDVFGDYSIIRYFLTTDDIAGGWENWLQVEFAKDFMSRDADGAGYYFDRELPYPDGGGRCDLVFQGLRDGEDHGVPVWLELKTQRSGADTTALTRFGEDLDKMMAQDAEFADSYIRVCAVVQRLIEQDIPALRRLPAYLRRGTMRCYAIRDNGTWLDVTDSFDNRANGRYTYLNEIIIVAYRGT